MPVRSARTKGSHSLALACAVGTLLRETCQPGSDVGRIGAEGWSDALYGPSRGIAVHKR